MVYYGFAFCFGVVALIRGQFAVTRWRGVYGIRARIVGLLLIFHPAPALLAIVPLEVLEKSYGYRLDGSLICTGIWFLGLVAALVYAGLNSEPIPSKRQMLAGVEGAEVHFRPGLSSRPAGETHVQEAEDTPRTAREQTDDHFRE
jgi:hypothetical protein